MAHAMESAALTVTPESTAEPTAVLGEPTALHAFLLTINPFVNFRRWVLAHLVYWCAFLVVVLVVRLVLFLMLGGLI